ncbi:MAG: S8 family serine peptidase [Caldilineaceae bacterium]
MSVYIIRPKQTLETLSAGLISVRLAAEDRPEQIQEVFSNRMKNPVRQDIHRWISENSPKVEQITKSESDTRITGVTIVDMSDEDAERLRQELPDATVQRDQPIELIRPRRPLAAPKKTLRADDLWHLRAIGLTSARKSGYTGSGAGVTVAVLDTGIDSTHLEIEGRVTKAVTFDVKQWQSIPMNSSRDTDGHGTHVTGLICGKKVGVAPGVKVLNGVMIPQGNGNLSDFILALEWAGSQPEVQIINMSAGIPGFYPDMQVAVDGAIAAGVLCVFATGNEGRNKTRSPGNYIDPVSIGAIDRESHVASFSSSGTLIVENHQYSVPDLVAPGVQVYSSVMGGGYEAWDGTSMATPIVSGVAALILEKHPDITIPDLTEELISTCRNLRQPVDRQGAGLVQVKAAL